MNDEMNEETDEMVVEEEENETPSVDETDDQVADEYHVREGFELIAEKVSAKQELDDSELDQVADVAIGIIRNMLSYFDVANALIDEYDGDNGELIFNITGDDLGILIGYHGKVLESFQYLFSTLLNHTLGFRFPARVDIEGYENRQTQKLQHLALSSAKRAIQRGTEVRMRPMKPYERRIIHLTLRSNPNVTTHSEGSEPNRYVVIKPIRR
jgi:spoIIIJ-associated protein